MLPATTTRSDEPDEAISIDDALSRAGGFGRFQRRMLVALMLAMQSFMYASMLPVLLLPQGTFKEARLGRVRCNNPNVVRSTRKQGVATGEQLLQHPGSLLNLHLVRVRMPFDAFRP